MKPHLEWLEDVKKEFKNTIDKEWKDPQFDFERYDNLLLYMRKIVDFTPYFIEKAITHRLESIKEAIEDKAWNCGDRLSTQNVVDLEEVLNILK